MSSQLPVDRAVCYQLPAVRAVSSQLPVIDFLSVSSQLPVVDSGSNLGSGDILHKATYVRTVGQTSKSTVGKLELLRATYKVTAVVLVAAAEYF